MITERQLRSRARKVQEADHRLRAAQTARDAAIAQAAAERRFNQVEIAGFVGVTKARVGRIVNNEAREGEHAQ